MIYPKHPIRSLLTSMLRKAIIRYPSDVYTFSFSKSKMYCLCTRCIIVNSVQVRSEFGKFVYTAICMRKCTLWSDNTCVFTRFHSIQNANTQLIWSSATCTKHLLNLDVLVWLFAFSCYTIHTSLKNYIYQCIGYHTV